MEENLATKEDIGRIERTLGERIDKVDKRIDNAENTLGRRIDKVERTLGERIDKVDKNLGERITGVEKTLGERIDKVAIQVVKNSEAISNMVTRDEFNEFREEMVSGQEKMITILTRLDQERIFTTEWIKRIETDVDKNKKEIEGIKLRLAIH